MIKTKFLDELENLIIQMRRALRRKESLNKLGAKIRVNVPFVNKQIEYTITQADKDKIEQEATEKEQEFKDKIKEIDKP